MALACIAKATILRLPCQTSAHFTVFRRGERLINNVIRTDHGIDDVKCMVKCVEHPKCRSYNVNTKELRCELNSKAHVDNGTKLADFPDWLYKSTNYEDLLIGEVCRKLSPCKSGVLCKDKCEPPYYECINCDRKNTSLHCDVLADGNGCSSNPCKNAGSCIEIVSTFKCNCAAGYTGKNCEKVIDSCESLPCFNGAICVDTVANFTCKCPAGYFGRNCQTSTCKSFGESGIKSGLHHISLPSGPYLVYCEMDVNGGGYTFLSPDSLSEITANDIKILFTDNKDVLLRILKPDGLQPYTLIKQYTDTGGLSVQINSFHGYTGPRSGGLADYIYLGTLPIAQGRLQTLQGFISNDINVTFNNCDGNPGNRFVFYSKPINFRLNEAGYYERAGLAVKWRGTAKSHPDPDNSMPLKFFMITEVAYGGCGCFTESNVWPGAVNPANGTAIGIR